MLKKIRDDVASRQEAEFMDAIQKKTATSSMLFVAVAILCTIITSIAFWTYPAPADLLAMEVLSAIPAIISGSILAPRAGPHLLLPSIFPRKSHEPMRFEIISLKHRPIETGEQTMAMIGCPECGRKVSNKAVNCPGCGVGITGAPESRGAGVQLLTIQETSKKFKLHSLLATIMIIIGIIGVYGSIDTAGGNAPPSSWFGLMVFVGLLWLGVTRFRVWWHHK